MGRQDAANVRVMKTKMQSCSRGREATGDGERELRPATTATTERSGNAHAKIPPRSFAFFPQAELRLMTTRLLRQRQLIHFPFAKFRRACPYDRQSSR